MFCVCLDVRPKLFHSFSAVKAAAERLIYFFLQRCLTPAACAASQEAHDRLLDLISALNSCQSAAGERCAREIDTAHFCLSSDARQTVS